MQPARPVARRYSQTVRPGCGGERVFWCGAEARSVPGTMPAMWSKQILDEVLSSDWVSRLTIDELLSIFWLPSVARGRAREIERAMTDLGARLQRAVTYTEVAGELNISFDEVRAWLERIGRLKNDPLDALRNLSDSHGDA